MAFPVFLNTNIYWGVHQISLNLLEFKSLLEDVQSDSNIRLGSSFWVFFLKKT